MKFVFDNIIFSKEKQGGISNYWYEITKKYQNNNEAFFFEEKKASDNIFRKKLNNLNLVQHYQLPLPLARLLPIHYKSSSNFILYHSSFYRKLITKARVCEITTVHDFLHHKHSPTLKKIIHNRLKFDSIKRAKGIICVSHNTLKDFRKYYEPKKSQKVAVIYNGVGNDYHRLIKEGQQQKFIFDFNLDDQFLLYVGARSNYKNFDFVVELLSHLPQYKLVVVGNMFSEKEKNKIPENLFDRIVVAKNISNNELNILYNFAHALVYPSSFEGFGIPVIEAMRAGCPVLALNYTSIPEVADGAALLFDSLDILKFKQAIACLQKTDYRMEIINAGLENARRFDWEKCSKETADFYQEVYSSF